jgi:hypothetical protein
MLMAAYALRLMLKPEIGRKFPFFQHWQYGPLSSAGSNPRMHGGIGQRSAWAVVVRMVAMVKDAQS